MDQSCHFWPKMAPFRRCSSYLNSPQFLQGRPRQHFLQTISVLSLGAGSSFHRQEHQSCLREPNEHRLEVSSVENLPPAPQSLSKILLYREMPGHLDQQISCAYGRIEKRAW